ncbi:major facilitator superfamily domain-containing protein, putative [Plasmodium vinckei vinckei]|uniref:Major facilitator superfamily domain-containing protein, putative n=1 Tax=Plasmodium vinckei vinckei TaxID=54757 RepID=A0A449BPM9_PLAVN|nr:major facilitator superfamily domain-containing protein, putative [Plasmodium vinckei vinckei]VEV55404.1 major facilitator superfamily domain-containing protein, putative [Plasmodium vinckei vinckei]
MTKVSAVIFWYFCFFVYVWYINIVCVYPLKFNDVHFIIYYFIQGCGSLLLGLFSDIYGKRKCLNISFLFLIASFSTILLTISSSDFLFINNITNFNNQKYDIHSNQNVFAQDDSPNNLMHFFSPKKGNDFFDKNDNFSENKYKILNSHNNNIQDDNNYMNKSENENLSHITDIYSNNNHDQNVLSEKDKNPNNDNISNIETVNTRGDNTDDVENLTAKHGNQHTNSSNKYIEIKLKLNNNFQKLHEQLIKKVTNDIKKKNNDILNKKYINNIIQLCVKTNLKKYIMDLKNYNIGMAKNVRRKKGVITNNDNDNNNYYYYSRNYADSENSDIYMENNYDHIVNKCVDGIISMYNDGENDNYVTGQNDDLYLSNNENLQNNKPTIKFLETLFEKSDKSESKYSYIYKILFYLITFASGFFAKGISNILCIIITENIKSNYRTKGVCLIYIIENISLILIRSLFVFNTYINLFILYKINILVCIFLNIVIIILLNIYFSDINHNVLKIQKDNINKLQNHENGIENNPLPNDDDNDSNSDINDEKKKKKKKNFFSFFKKKNIDSNNSENANYDTIQVFKIDKNYNDIKRELSNDILKLKAAANIINNEESINLELMNKDMENNILDNASDLSDDISNIPNELTNKRNATDEVINILSDNSDIVSDIPNIDNSANEINETNNSKSSPKKNFKKLSTLAKINNKKIGLKKSKTIGVSYKHILNGKMLKTIDKNELLEKLNKNDEYLQYIEELKNNNLFNIYKMWVKYTFKAHTYVVWALCLLYFMFNFLYISFFVIYNIFIYDIKSQFHFYTYNNSFIVLNCVLLVFYLFLYCNLKNKIIKVLNLFGCIITTFISFSFILFIYSTSHFSISLHDHTYILYTIIFYMFLSIPNVSLFLFYTFFSHTLCKGLLLGMFVFFGHLGFITYAIIRFFIVPKYLAALNLIFSCIICIISFIVIILYIPQASSSINYKRIDEAYFYHFLLYLSNKKIVSPHYINMAVSSEEK